VPKCSHPTGFWTSWYDISDKSVRRDFVCSLCGHTVRSEIKPK